VGWDEMIIDDISNHLADMDQDLPIYRMLFPSDVINCICVFPSGGGIEGHIGISPMHYTESDGSVGSIDLPGIQIQVRYTDPFGAFARCEAIRIWLDENNPPGYILTRTTRSQPDDLTNNNDLSMSGGPAYRFSADFSTAKVR
jgi:hypothetical protein